jgi:hypothetical protein
MLFFSCSGKMLGQCVDYAMTTSSEIPSSLPFAIIILFSAVQSGYLQLTTSVLLEVMSLLFNLYKRT